MAKVTSSRDRSKGSAKRPVTTSRGRGNRQGASNAKVTQGSNGRPVRVPEVRTRPGQPAGGAPVTTDRGRPSPGSGGNAKVTRGTGARPGLPPAGGSSGNTDRAKLQQGWARDRGAKDQFGRNLETVGRGLSRLLGLDRQSQAQARAAAAARGTRGDGVRVVGPGGANPTGQPRLPAGRNAGALPPGRQGGSLANRPAGGQLATRPTGGPLANRGSSALANRPNSTPVDGRLVGVNVAEIQRRSRLGGQQALPSGQRALPPGGRGGSVTDTRIERVNVREVPSNQGRLPAANWGKPVNPGGNRGGAITSSPGGALANRPNSNSSGGGDRGRPSSGGGQRALPPGRPGSPSSTPRPAAGSSLTGRIVRGGGGALGIAGPLLTPLVQNAGRAAGQWLGANVLRPAARALDDAMPGINSWDEQRRVAARQGGRQGPPVPERILKGGSKQPPASRPSQGSSRPQQAPSRPSSSPSQPPRTPQRPSSSPALRQAPASAPSGRNGDPMQGRNGGFQVEGSPLTPEPAPAAAPGARSQAPVSASRPSASRSSGSSATSTPAGGQSPAPEASGGQSGRQMTDWERKFNPGRGTSRTNNPLLINDSYLMGKMKQREAAASSNSSPASAEPPEITKARAEGRQFSTRFDRPDNKAELAIRKKKKERQ